MSNDTTIPSIQATGAGFEPNATREIRRAETAARLGVFGDFARIPQLAKALGMAANSIYAQIRVGTFPIAHRRIGSVVVVKLDDYIEWFYAEPTRSLPAKAVNERHAEPRARIETAEERSERIKREAGEARDGMRRRNARGA